MMKRRDLFGLGRQATLSAFTATAINHHALFAEESPSAPNSLEGRVAGVLQAYDAQGNHRTGTEVDNASARWLAHEARQAGAHVALEPFSFSRVDPQSSYLRIGEYRIDTVPLFDAGFTGPAGVEGKIGPLALVLAGDRCEKVMARLIVNVPVKDVEADEIWSFLFKKEKAVELGDDPNFGDQYCFTAIERHSKLILNFALGKRNEATTNVFIEGLRHATASENFQITTDGFVPYKSAIDTTLSDRVDFAQLIKVYRAATPDDQRRYSPAEVVNTEVVPVCGNPEPERICTSHVERQNLTMRTNIRRFTRLTNGFSKKWENHWAALCLWFGYYNFCRIHSSIRVTPAIEAGITDHVWDLAELLA